MLNLCGFQIVHSSLLSIFNCVLKCLYFVSFPIASMKTKDQNKRFWCLKARSHDPSLRIRFLLVPKIGSCEHIENDLPTHGSVILKKKRMEIEHALFSSDSLLER